MLRQELIARTRQLVDEGERLQANPTLARPPDLAAAERRPARRGLGIDGPLPPVVAHGRQAEGHRPWPPDDARRGGGLRPRGRGGEDGGAPDEPRCRGAPGNAVRRRGPRDRTGQGMGSVPARRTTDDRAADHPRRRTASARSRSPIRSLATTCCSRSGSTSMCLASSTPTTARPTSRRASTWSRCETRRHSRTMPTRSAAGSRTRRRSRTDATGSTHSWWRWPRRPALAGDRLPYLEHSIGASRCSRFGATTRCSRRPRWRWASCCPARPRSPSAWPRGTPGSRSRWSACRRRRLARAGYRARAAHLFGLPGDEDLRVSLVRDQPWGAYNWYDGGLRSRVDINTDLPIRASDLVHTVAHETFPGHHLEHAWKEASSSTDSAGSRPAPC